jgi:hypothetical protein
VGDIDSLAAESVKDLREDLEDMQFEDSPEDMMDHQALGHTDDQIRRIATYFATLQQDRPRGIPSIDLRSASFGNGGGSGGDEDGEDREDDRDHDDRFGSVASINASAKTVELASGTRLPYDSLVLATGTDFDEVPG